MLCECHPNKNGEEITSDCLDVSECQPSTPGPAHVLSWGRGQGTGQGWGKQSPPHAGEAAVSPPLCWPPPKAPASGLDSSLELTSSLGDTWAPRLCVPFSLPWALKVHVHLCSFSYIVKHQRDFTPVPDTKLYGQICLFCCLQDRG